MLRVWNQFRRWADQCSGQRRFGSRWTATVRAISERHRRADAATLTSVAGRLIYEADHEVAVATALGLFDAALERTLGWSAFDVQLQAAALMNQGRAVEMQTGEGKTLTVAAAAAALALSGRRVHVATVNRYLAGRDFQTFAPVLRQLGLAVGLIYDGQPPAAKRAAYACPIVYGTGYEFGFDYLREQLALLRSKSPRLGERFRKPVSGAAGIGSSQITFDCAIVDELDSVLLDEACVPLILSEPLGTPNEDAASLARAEAAAAALHLGEHFIIDPVRRTLNVTPTGYNEIDRLLQGDLAGGLRRPWRQYVEQALVARHMLRRDVDYLVADGRIWLVDLATGRVFDDRRWPEGLQHAVEFKERVPFSQPTAGAARITRQRFFGLYRTLTGTSGTLTEASDELRRTYRLDVHVVAPRLPSQRVERPTRYCPDDLRRLKAVVAETTEEHRRGRPVLVGCRTIAASRAVSATLTSAGLSHRVLNGCQDDEEAQIVGRAGRSAAITVATNLAGRGTDITLDDPARRAGGLHVVGVERHDSPRVDRQLLGRAARQGDPGSGRFFVSADDALIRPFSATFHRLAALPAPQTDDEQLRRDVAQCQAALEAEARLRRRESAAYEGRLDDLLATLAKTE